jgi:leucyl-tRNA synthetase
VIERMAKSRGNVINPDEVIESHGADAMRLYELFMGPFDKGAPWSTDGIAGVYRFLQRSWRLLVEEAAPGEPTRTLEAGPGTEAQQRLLALTIDGVTSDVEAMQFNTAIAKLMVFVREIEKEAPLPLPAARSFVLLLAPFAPHVAEELWQRLGEQDSLARAPWPEAESRWLVADVLQLVVQVNGKRRDQIEVAADADEEAIRAAALAAPNVSRHLEGREPRRVIVVPGRLVNIVIVGPDPG